jgi:hypothetical protein
MDIYKVSYLHQFEFVWELRTFKILTTHFSLFVMLMASNTSEYLPRPSFLTTWKSSCTLKEALP